MRAQARRLEGILSLSPMSETWLHCGVPLLSTPAGAAFCTLEGVGGKRMGGSEQPWPGAPAEALGSESRGWTQDLLRNTDGQGTSLVC